MHKLKSTNFGKYFEIEENYFDKIQEHFFKIIMFLDNLILVKKGMENEKVICFFACTTFS